MCTDQVCSIPTNVCTTCVYVEAIMKCLGLRLRRGGTKYISKYILHVYICTYICMYVPLTADSISHVCVYVYMYVLRLQYVICCQW